MSFGHQRGQIKAADRALLSAAEFAWMDYYVKGAGSVPFQGVTTLTQTCPNAAPSGGPYYADNWADLAPGEVSFTDAAPKTILPTAGSPTIANTFDPVNGGGACATTSPADQPDTATYRSDPVPAGGYTLMGSPTVIADITLPERELADRREAPRRRPGRQHPDAGRPRALAARDQRRPRSARCSSSTRTATGSPTGTSRSWSCCRRTHPTGESPTARQNVTVENLELRLPVLEQPGSLGGVVGSPAPKFLPAGYQLARDFQPAYVRPRGATPFRAALVPAFKPCTVPNSTHGSPLAFPSCGPPAPGLAEPHGRHAGRQRPAGQLGRLREHEGGARPDRNTPADEADAILTVSLTDVRQTVGLGDYTGQLQETATVRITDRASGPAGDEGATLQDISYPVVVPCTPTASTSIGSTCSLVTGLNAVVPGTISGGKRAIWELGQIQVRDGGPDGVVSTAPGNALFAVQGVFTP